MSEGHAWFDHLWTLASGWLLLLVLLLLVFVVFCWDLGGVLFLFCAKFDNDRTLGNWKHRALLNTKILVNTKPSSDYEYRDIQIDEWIRSGRIDRMNQVICLVWVGNWTVRKGKTLPSFFSESRSEERKGGEEGGREGEIYIYKDDRRFACLAYLAIDLCQKDSSNSIHQSIVVKKRGKSE